MVVLCPEIIIDVFVKRTGWHCYQAKNRKVKPGGFRAARLYH
jgi:hypothetical protein